MVTFSLLVHVTSVYTLIKIAEVHTIVCFYIILEKRLHLTVISVRSTVP